jgi:hypothetical protein
MVGGDRGSELTIVLGRAGGKAAEVVGRGI